MEAAERYLVQTEAVRSHPDALLAATRDWVTLHIEAGSTVAPAMDPIAHGPLADLTEDLGSSLRWQYAIVNVGMFHSAERMGSALAAAGAHGWELVTIYDKASNGWAELEKGFLLLKRQVPPGVAPRQWCYVLRG
ncbi:MAG: hypothetical protein S0880_17575 [Actinomycetota bacterium]|nr:hypothetical protein [Actinomycetota bacterium]